MTGFANRLRGFFGSDDGPSEGNLARARQVMVEEQIVARGVTDERVLAAFRKVPRHRFVSTPCASKAYGDFPLPIGQGQTISQPYMVAVMTEILAPGPGEVVLEVGTGSGYQAAILAELAAKVHTIERHPDLAARASATLLELGYSNLEFHVGDGTLGWPDASPYDGILVTAGAPSVPESLKLQLAEGGRLVIPVGPTYQQWLHRVVRRGTRFDETRSQPCVFVKLLGAEGWAHS